MAQIFFLFYKHIICTMWFHKCFHKFHNTGIVAFYSIDRIDSSFQYVKKRFDGALIIIKWQFYVLEITINEQTVIRSNALTEVKTSLKIFITPKWQNS